MEQHTIKLALNGIMCAGCVNTVEKALRNDPHVVQAEINFANRTAQVITTNSASQLINIVEKSGYGAKEIIDQEKAEQERLQQEQIEYRRKLRSAMFALLFSVPLMLYGFIGGSMAVETSTQQLVWLSVGIVTLLLMLITGRHFFKGAWKSFKNRNANMDTLIAVGTGTAWLYSIFVVIAPQLLPTSARHLYFEASLMIIGLINLGQAMELKARGRTSQAIHRLLDLRVKKALLIQDGKEVEVDIDVVQNGDLLRARAGEKIAVDGVITQGETTIDESMLTGEPLPIHKRADDVVSAGTVNGSGTIIYRATQVGSETKLAQIIEMVGKAQNSKPPISHLADRVAAVFVPSVMIIAIISALIWYNFGPAPTLIHMIVVATSVLIIACPCALGLATPISTMIGVGKSAEYGGLIRNGEALQQASNLDVVVVDKTGTLTQGKPSVTETVYVNDAQKEQILSFVYALEQGSHHPLALALRNHSEQYANPQLSINNFQDLTALGVQGTINGKRYLLGSNTLMKKQNINLDDTLKQKSGMWQTQAKTVIYLSEDDQVIAVFAINDPLREDTLEAIKQLQQQNINVIMLTGDNQHSASAVAKACGINEFYAELLPTDKLKHIKALQKSGLKVGMVGDGINDAPALAQSDVSFAVGAGTDVAIEAADITLMRNSLSAVLDVIEISHATMRNIKQNLWGAFIYNSLGIPIAAGLLFPFTGWLLSPIIAGTAMSMSSVTVVTNANRLRLFKPQAEK